MISRVAMLCENALCVADAFIINLNTQLSSDPPRNLIHV